MHILSFTFCLISNISLIVNLMISSIKYNDNKMIMIMKLGYIFLWIYYEIKSN